MTKKQKNLEKLRNADVYPVISPGFTKGRDLVSVMEELAECKPSIVQLRMKNESEKEIFRMACEFRRICERHEILFILNDRPDIALEAGADGVHLGQDDLPFEAIAKFADKLIIGVSTHSLEEALEAQEKGADYINIGPIYDTATKSLSMKSLGVGKILEIKPHLKIPFSVMGGIKMRHIPELVAAGAKMIAMVTEITEADNIKERFCEIRNKYSQSRQ